MTTLLGWPARLGKASLIQLSAMRTYAAISGAVHMYPRVSLFLSSATKQEDDQWRNRTMSYMEDPVFLRALLDGKWRVRILGEFCAGTVRLGQLQRAVPDASKKVLIDNLRSLEKMQWIVRRDLSTNVLRVEYVLADAWAERIKKTVDAFNTK
jgi:DNA-binding HxlR family transcriptional regulator